MELEKEHDDDYAEAINENEIVLVKKRSTVKAYLELLQQVDPAYNQERHAQLNAIFDSLLLAEVDADMHGESGVSSERYNDSTDPVQIYMQGQRQTDMERQIIRGSGTGETNDPQEEDTAAAAAASEEPDMVASPEGPEGDDGMYL